MAVSFEEIGLEAGRRWRELNAGERPWIRIGTALCGEAAGAFEVADAVESELASQGVSAQFSRVGCLGLCFAEPLLDVQLPGGHRIFYGNVVPEGVAEIISAHVAGGKPVTAKALGYLAQEGSDVPVPDGIPDLRSPKMLTPEEADYLQPRERVFGISINGDHRAYPLRITNAHEMVNDTVGGEPISLSW